MQEAWLLKACAKAGSAGAKRAMSWSTFPDAQSTATAESRFPSSVALVIHTTPSAITGLDQAFPGIGVFQATTFVSLHSTGSPASCDTPSPVGPRNSLHGVSARAGPRPAHSPARARSARLQDDHRGRERLEK